MAKLLIIDSGGCGLDFAIRCKMAGHDVKTYYQSKKRPNVGRGLISFVADWRAHMKWADLILLTYVNVYAEELEWYFKEGYPIFGANKASTRLEVDRDFGQEVLRSCGLPVIPYTKFEKLDEAYAFIEASKPDARFVSKTCGDDDRALSYVSKSRKDMLFMMDHWKRNNKIKSAIILQQFVKGIEMGVGGWFGPHGFNAVIEENFEHKKLMPGEIGVNTGEMGTAVKYVEDSHLFDETLGKCTSALHALGFVGNVDLNLMIDDEGVCWPLEFTMRLGQPTFHIQESLHKGDPLNWMIDLVHGTDSLHVRSDHAIGVLMAIADFPSSHLTGPDVEGFPVYGVSEENFADIHLQEIMAGMAPVDEGDKVVERELFVSAGNNLLTVVGRGKSVKQAKEKAYALVGQIELPNSPIYRNDIGNRLEEQLPELQKHGYATEWRFA